MLSSEQKRNEERSSDKSEAGGKHGGGRVEGAVGALVGAADLADAEDVEGGRVECLHKELLRPQRLNDHSLPGSGQVGHGVVSENGFVSCLKISSVV